MMPSAFQQSHPSSPMAKHFIASVLKSPVMFLHSSTMVMLTSAKAPLVVLQVELIFIIHMSRVSVKFFSCLAPSLDVDPEQERAALFPPPIVTRVEARGVKASCLSAFFIAILVCFSILLACLSKLATLSFNIFIAFKAVSRHFGGVGTGTGPGAGTGEGHVGQAGQRVFCLLLFFFFPPNLLLFFFFPPCLLLFFFFPPCLLPFFFIPPCLLLFFFFLICSLSFSSCIPAIS